MTELGNRLGDSFVARLTQMLRDYRRGLLGGRPGRRRTMAHSQQQLPNIVAVLLDDLTNIGTVEASILELELTNEVQVVQLLGEPTGGNFTLSFRPQATAAAEVTAPISWDATAVQVRDALGGLPSLEPGDLSVDRLPGSWIVTFGGRFADTDVELMTADGNGLDSPSGIPADVDVINESWSDTGTTAEVRLPVPVGSPTPAVRGAMVACVPFSGAGYGVVALECRRLNLGYGGYV